MRAVTDTIFDGDEAKVEPITKLIRVIEAKTEESHYAHFGWFETDSEGIIYTINKKEIYWVMTSQSQEQKRIVHNA